ncbi:MAG: aminotransferase class I/II-fold pyridoxal phosphate-dependent enzyme, partial [Flavobacteriia bacterium]|nr:aminotransferase class I/II-fold pyridoxal phosphate-dependent enzyme [Flavobacteriia bacterium]
EAYIDFTQQDSYVTLLEQYPNLVVTQTLSKAYGLAGIRLGVLMASAEIISILHKIKPPYNVNTLSQEQAALRLANPEVVQSEIMDILEQRNQLESALKEVSFVKETIPSQANFILARVDHATKRYAQLIEKGIVVRNRSKQLHCENTLRFTVGTPLENKVLIDTLKSLA